MSIRTSLTLANAAAAAVVLSFRGSRVTPSGRDSATFLKRGPAPVADESVLEITGAITPSGIDTVRFVGRLPVTEDVSGQIVKQSEMTFDLTVKCHASQTEAQRREIVARVKALVNSAHFAEVVAGRDPSV